MRREKHESRNTGKESKMEGELKLKKQLGPRRIIYPQLYL
ncbi:hypothetical protein BVRB_3g062760 [Beta vulgaris subsp. vulgaris]|nr:hypothetical protein BVRB_3g062760 [Beta vulgaris subsp. vulgaris]